MFLLPFINLRPKREVATVFCRTVRGVVYIRITRCCRTTLLNVFKRSPRGLILILYVWCAGPNHSSLKPRTEFDVRWRRRKKKIRRFWRTSIPFYFTFPLSATSGWNRFYNYYRTRQQYSNDSGTMDADSTTRSEEKADGIFVNSSRL